MDIYPVRDLKSYKFFLIEVIFKFFFLIKMFYGNLALFSFGHNCCLHALFMKDRFEITSLKRVSKQTNLKYIEIKEHLLFQANICFVIQFFVIKLIDEEFQKFFC